MGIAEVIKNPGKTFSKTERERAMYKMLMGGVLLPRRVSRKSLARELPPVPKGLELPREEGFLTIGPEKVAQYPSVNLSVQKVLGRCRKLMESGHQSVEKSKSYLREVTSKQDLKKYPEFLELALHPEILAVATQYLGELPVLAGVKFLHSVPGETLQGSQLYHCDHDDVRQMKIFVHVSDVDEASGPLTIINANASQKLRKKLNYSYGGYDGHVDDDLIRAEAEKAGEKVLTGPPGTMTLIDTSQVFHFGSRVSTKDRYVMSFQYVTLTSFIYHPLMQLLPFKMVSGHYRTYPYGDLASGALSPVQRAVLTGRTG